MQVYIVDYETDSEKGYKVIEGRSIAEAYSAILEWFNNQSPQRYLRIRIIADHGEPFGVL